ncbi:ribosomal protein L6 [Rozella allomycis CSF55]|uniref:Ribosomal protein L6 n=1 Tax=Rozella allomycis (strain CSF55) TaxID=988480 RepID=A0A075B0U5_ROZAC|nr:Ribosomal protein L6 domain-containing protein [Rozella allomycis CSF55]RKP21865.1 ribosomal protein L6 [Rozella allomycis CSF55]|eukprot:EPZ36179.1 Ribosomal protein L6 domain-containing protein [Rozella allomycis CSF55]
MKFKEFLRERIPKYLRELSPLPVAKPVSFIGAKPVIIDSRIKYRIEPAINPLPYPKTHKMTMFKHNIVFEGPLGKLGVQIPEGLNVVEEDGYEENESADKEFYYRLKSKWQRRFVRSMFGTCRQLMEQYAYGVLDGYKVPLTLVGVGFRASVEGENLDLRLGFCHPVIIKIPSDIKVEVPFPTRIIVSGITMGKVKNFAAIIRSKYKPEPYKGKGIYIGEEKCYMKKRKSQYGNKR